MFHGLLLTKHTATFPAPTGRQLPTIVGPRRHTVAMVGHGPAAGDPPRPRQPPWKQTRQCHCEDMKMFRALLSQLPLGGSHPPSSARDDTSSQRSDMELRREICHDPGSRPGSRPGSATVRTWRSFVLFFSSSHWEAATDHRRPATTHRRSGRTWTCGGRSAATPAAALAADPVLPLWGLTMGRGSLAMRAEGGRLYRGWNNARKRHLRGCH